MVSGIVLLRKDARPDLALENLHKKVEELNRTDAIAFHIN